jgi:hypothetical protein
MASTEIQTSLRMSEALRDRLARAAAEAGRGLGEEVRRRLEASFGSAPVVEDPKTADLLRVIARAAAILDKQVAAWHADAGAFAVFKAAIEDVLSRQKPEATSAVPKTDRGAALFQGSSASPERAGEMLAFSAELAEGLI